METSARSIILKGVDRYQVVEPMFEGLRVILSYRGESFAPAYIQGISGAAFRVAGICQCAPTCGTAMQPQDLARTLGYAAEYLPLQSNGLEREHELQEVLARIKNELRAGQPALLWHAFTNAEWDVVCGYDEEMGVFYGRGSYAGVDGYACEAETRAINCLDICPALGALILGEKESTGDLRAAELAALREAVCHARAVKQEGADGKWTFLEGVQCYERWVREFRDDPTRGRTAGDSYCLGVMRSTHRAAAQFLREVAPAYPTGKRGLIRAANCFEAEAEALDACWSLLGWEAPEDPDPRRSAVIADLLAHACDAYATGIASIEQALDGIDTPGS